MHTNVLLPLLILVMTASSARSDDVVISEIMYHPASEKPGEEYIELLNTGGSTVDLTGWRFTSGIQFAFSNVTILPAAYLVVAANLPVFRNKYPSINNVVGGWQGLLSNSDEEIKLEDALGKEVDRLHYANEGDWGMRQRGPLDHYHQGWVWSAEHDGGGKSLELLNPALPNKHGQNWASSISPEGTPGRANSASRTNIAPLSLEVSHYPAIPRSTDSVAVTARFLDEHTNGVTATLHDRVDGTASFNATPMWDDGAHGDGMAGDGFYGAILPPRSHGVIVEFYLELRDAEGNTRTWPAPVQPAGTQSANLLYQVRDTVDAGPQPVYLLIMKEADRQELDYIGDTLPDALSDAQMNGTFISVDESGIDVYYTIGIRNRGHGGRTARPNNYHLTYPNDRRWKGVKALKLNTQFTQAQIAGSLLFSKSGIPTEVARPVQVRVNNANLALPGSPQYGSYAAIEALDSDFLHKHFPDDSGGNLYSARAADTPSTAEADLAYRGTNANSYTNTYFKDTNKSEDDWADLVELTRILTDTPAALYVAEARRVTEVNEWLRYFAMNALLDNNESGIYMGYGDDYSMYRGIQNPRFLLLAHDLDTIMGQGSDPGTTNAGIFRACDIPVVARLLQGPDFLPLYHAHLRGLIETTFSEAQMNAMLEEGLASFVPAASIQQMERFNANRIAYVLSILPHLIPIANTWKYNQSGADQGTAWREVGYNDAAWASGPALLYYEEAALPAPKRTPLDLGPATYYFRTHFTVHPAFTNVPSGLTIKISTVIDDGAVFYLNGQEIYRLSMPDGPIASSMTATRPVGDAVWEGPFTVYPSNLVVGDNLLAVEVHQCDPTSSDVVFGMTLDIAIEQISTVPNMVLLNEIMANNITQLDVNGKPTDWVELYNHSPTAVDLSDSSVTDNIDLPRKWVFPPSSIISPNGFINVRCDGGLLSSSTNTGFSLKQSGDQVYLFDKPANGGALLDSISFGLQAADLSIGRVPDGAPTWLLNVPTPASANVLARLGSPLGLKVNEWMANPSAGSDWFEIFNSQAYPVELSNLVLSDSLIDRTQSRIPALSFIAAGSLGFQKFDADGSPSKGANQANFKLSGSGEAIALFTSEGAVIDSVTFGIQRSGISQGRYPDGSTNVIFFAGSATPGASNLLLQRQQITRSGNHLLIHFDGYGAISYTVQYRNPVSGGAWGKLQDVFPAANGPVEVVGYHRPRQPGPLLSPRHTCNPLIYATAQSQFQGADFSARRLLHVGWCFD